MLGLHQWWQLNKLRVLNYELLSKLDELAAIHRDIEHCGGGFTPLARDVREFLSRVGRG